MNSKYDILEPVANKIRALDNPVKLKILAMLIEEGAKSVTDISRDMSLNFSTAHKYLEQLQAAGLVSSKEVSENRLKRMFFVEPFDLDISPHGIAKLVEGKKKDRPIHTFKVINEKGEEVGFEEKIFSQKYLKRGLPSSTIKTALDYMLVQAYDGITLIELRELFRQALSKKVENISAVMEMIESSEIRGKTYYNLLKLNSPEALKLHMEGDIFIQNLGEPKLLNFVHDIYGITQHGINGKKPKNIHDLFGQIIVAVKLASKFTLQHHSIDTFNYFIAPFMSHMGDGEIKQVLKTFLAELNGLGQKIYISLEFGMPKFIENLSEIYITETKHGEKTETYVKYHNVAKKIAIETVNIISKEKYENIKLVFKLWAKELPSVLQSGDFVANMTDNWQQPNASFVGFTRFDPDWKKWFGTNRIGEVQEIILNLPKLALTSASLEDFSNKVGAMIELCYRLILDMAELAAGEFLRTHNTNLLSAVRERWAYLHLEDSVYSIGIAGLPETINILTKKYKKQDIPTVAAKILNKFSDMKKKYSGIRINLKQNRSRSLSDRFSKFVAGGIKYDLPLPKQKLLAIQQYFPGGHVEFLTVSELEKLKWQFSFVRIV